MPTSSTPSSGSHRARVVAVLSAFRPEPALIAHCAALDPQVAGVIVVDDGSGEHAEAVLRQLEEAGVMVEPMNTPSAARSYNVTLAEGRRVACALIPL